MITLAAFLLGAELQASRPRTGATRPSPAAPRPTAEWLTGLWVQQDKPGSTDLTACASWSALFYRGDNSFSHGSREGFWTLQGRQVIETSRPVAELTPEQVAAATKSARVVARLGPDRMRQTSPGGRSVLFARCPRPETPVAR